MKDKQLRAGELSSAESAYCRGSVVGNQRQKLASGDSLYFYEPRLFLPFVFYLLNDTRLVSTERTKPVFQEKTKIILSVLRINSAVVEI